ncbi:hypothetical protein GCM10009836_25830 [Pseudonocardia ailaonensis]|uniref:Uncharacterized protein n=1 Tax=Pseudonocardia ailaonensis TaxID=367279 RepID=A0ABN2MZN0_9PSEU
MNDWAGAEYSTVTLALLASGRGCGVFGPVPTEAGPPPPPAEVPDEDVPAEPQLATATRSTALSTATQILRHLTTTSTMLFLDWFGFLNGGPENTILGRPGQPRGDGAGIDRPVDGVDSTMRERIGRPRSDGSRPAIAAGHGLRGQLLMHPRPSGPVVRCTRASPSAARWANRGEVTSNLTALSILI